MARLLWRRAPRLWTSRRQNEPCRPRNAVRDSSSVAETWRLARRLGRVGAVRRRPAREETASVRRLQESQGAVSAHSDNATEQVPISPSSPAPARRGPRALSSFLVAASLTIGSGLLACTHQDGLLQPPPPPTTARTPVLTNGSRAVDFTGQDLGGSTIRLSSFLGKSVVLMTFSITFCEPCVAELPHLRRIYDENKGKGLVVLGIAMDGPETIANVPAFARRHRLNYPVITDEDAHISSIYNPTKVAPLSVLIDRSGVVKMLHMGYLSGDEKLIQDEVAKALSGTGSADEEAERKAAKTIR